MSLKAAYSPEVLKEFDVVVTQKLIKAKADLKFMKESLAKLSRENLKDNYKPYDDMTYYAEKGNLVDLAKRQQRFIKGLESAKSRIANGTYGVCIVTGKRIAKERLLEVPHTTLSIEAKLNRDK